MRRREWIAGLLAAGQTAGFSRDYRKPGRGFRKEDWPAQKALEAKLRAVPSAAKIDAHLTYMAAEPHHAGSAGSRAVAEYALRQFRKFGFQAHIETFEAYLPYPKERFAEMVAPVRYRLRLAEPNFAEDADSRDKNQLPTYNAYSAAGDVTGEMVYVNYGVPDDYRVLREKGISVKGRIVLARYGGAWRGVKPKVAAENGAIGCLIFSDPKDDGFGKGKVYPEGPYRCEQGVQRGSVMDMSIHVGDPLSPGWASEKGSRRLPMSESKVLMRIPVLPISYGDAKPLLEQLGGDEVPEEWRGGLPLKYRFGPGPGKLRLKLTFEDGTRPVHNVIAKIPGAVWPDQWIMYGNHHDAWVNGAHDPISGASALLEAARAVGSAAKGGWKPRRTLVFALWDAEEFGLVGSTEWVEKHLVELREKGVVYFNSDANGKGKLSVGASPSLSAFLEEVAVDVDVKRVAEWTTGALGSGSDYVGFAHHAGIASANLGFSGEDGGGVYHSIFDSVSWYKRFSDGTFVHGKALAELMAVAMARMSDAALPPFEFKRLARSLEAQWKDLEKMGGWPDATAAPMWAQLRRLHSLAKDFEAAFAEASPTEAASRSIYKLERALQLPDGLPGRPWYKNALSAPGQYTGYGAKTMPGVREALELGRPDEALTQLAVLTSVLDRFNTALAETIRLLR